MTACTWQKTSYLMHWTVVAKNLSCFVNLLIQFLLALKQDGDIESVWNFNCLDLDNFRRVGPLAHLLIIYEFELKVSKFLKHSAGRIGANLVFERGCKACTYLKATFGKKNVRVRIVQIRWVVPLNEPSQSLVMGVCKKYCASVFMSEREVRVEASWTFALTWRTQSVWDALLPQFFFYFIFWLMFLWCHW